MKEKGAVAIATKGNNGHPALTTIHRYIDNYHYYTTGKRQIQEKRRNKKKKCVFKQKNGIIFEKYVVWTKVSNEYIQKNASIPIYRYIEMMVYRRMRREVSQNYLAHKVGGRIWQFIKSK